MLIIDNPNLPTTPIAGNGAASFIVNPVNLPTIVQSDVLAVRPGIVRGGEPAAVEANPGAPVGEIYMVEIPDAANVIAISTPAGNLTAADDPSNIQQGEFVYNPYDQTVLLRSSIDISGLSVLVLQGQATGIFRQDFIPPPHPEWFNRFPLVGQLSIGLDFEQQPTGSLEFECQLIQLQALLNALRPDTLIDLYGYAFRVTQTNFTQSYLSTQPQGRFVVTVSLSGANERSLTDPISLRQILDFVDSIDSEPVIETTVQVLGEIAGITIDAPTMELSLEGLNSDDTFNIDSEFTDRLRHQGLFAEYNTNSLKARPIDSVAEWAFTDNDCLEPPQVTYLGRQPKQSLNSAISLAPLALNAAVLPTIISAPPTIQIQPESDDLIGNANEFLVTRIEGEFSEAGSDDDSEDLLGQNAARPQWNQRRPDRTTLVKGDEALTRPPEETTDITTTSLCFVNSGPTKTQETETSENGNPVSVETKVYGFVFLSKDHMRLKNGELVLSITDPGTVWELIRETTTTWVYDDETGYELGTVTTGRELFSFKAESDALETYELDQETDPISVADLNTYQFRWRAVNEAVGRSLRKLSSVYNDVSENEGRYVYFQEEAPNGQIITRRRRDPSFVTPYYVETEISHSNSFAQTQNPEEPEQIGGQLRRLPNLTTGRESFNRVDTKIKASPATRKVARIESIPETNGETQVSSRVNAPGDLVPDAYTVVTQEMSAEGPNYRDFASRSVFDENLGRPGEAARRPSDFQQVEPESGQSGSDLPDDTSEYEYIVTSPGNDPNGPALSTLSFPYAETVAEAETAVRTYAIAAEITNPSRSISITIGPNLQIKPGDKVRLTLAGIVYQCRVNTVNHSITLSGIIDGQLELTGQTTLQLSPGREPDFTFTRRPVPQDADIDESNETISFTNVSGLGDATLSMGGLLRGRLTRRNPNG